MEKIVPGVLGESVAVVPLIQGGHSLVQVLVEHAEVAVAFLADLRTSASVKPNSSGELRAQADVRAAMLKPAVTPSTVIGDHLSR